MGVPAAPAACAMALRTTTVSGLYAAPFSPVVRALAMLLAAASRRACCTSMPAELMSRIPNMPMSTIPAVARGVTKCSQRALDGAQESLIAHGVLGHLRHLGVEAHAA